MRRPLVEAHREPAARSGPASARRSPTRGVRLDAPRQPVPAGRARASCDRRGRRGPGLPRPARADGRALRARPVRAAPGARLYRSGDPPVGAPTAPSSSSAGSTTRSRSAATASSCGEVEACWRSHPGVGEAVVRGPRGAARRARRWSPTWCQRRAWPGGGRWPGPPPNRCAMAAVFDETRVRPRWPISPPTSPGGPAATRRAHPRGPDARVGGGTRSRGSARCGRGGCWRSGAAPACSCCGWRLAARATWAPTSRGPHPSLRGGLDRAAGPGPRQLRHAAPSTSAGLEGPSTSSSSTPSSSTSRASTT